MKTVIAIFALVAMSSSAVAQTKKTEPKKAEAAVIWDGNKLHDLCQHYKADQLKTELGVACFSFILGVTQTLLLIEDSSSPLRHPCPGKNVTETQIADVVVKWMEDHPEKRDLPAPWVVMKALYAAFPCS